MKRRSFIAGLAACAMLARESMSIFGEHENPMIAHEKLLQGHIEYLQQIVREAWIERYREAYGSTVDRGDVTV
jgi:hypothetical protein